MKEAPDTFLRLPETDEDGALEHVLLAEEQAEASMPVAATDPAEIRDVVVAGGGITGASIAHALDRAGIRTVIVETDKDAAERTRANIARLGDDTAGRDPLPADGAAARQARIRVATDFGDLPAAGLAIEAENEDMAAKRQVFSELEKALPGHAVLASSTGWLDVDEIAQSVSDPSRVIGLHFSSPAHITRLLEIVRGPKSGDRAISTGFAVAKRLRKIPVLAGVCGGSIGNRILARCHEAADTVLMDGSTPWEVDEAMVEFGYAMGPYEAQDLSGLDIAYANRKRQAPNRDPNRRYIPISDRMVEEGRLGRKASVGWYRYPGGGGKVVDPLIEDLVREEAYFAKVARREFSPDEIRTRLVCAMINEAADILNEGMAARAADIDLVTIHGHGFPRQRGGLMYYADRIGCGALIRQIEDFASEDPVAWKPSPLLARLAETSGRFCKV
ncbi:MAG: hypothetical protein Kow0026_01310 [Oricola sp.]